MSQPEQVSRKVYFFRLGHINDFIDKIPMAIQHITELPFNENGRYQAVTNEDTLLALFVDKPTFPIEMHFARIRRDNLPVVEKGGEISPLSLADGAGLMDSSHMVIFKDGYVAAEFNQDAPRIRMLGPYILLKGGFVPSAPKFLPLFQRDVLSELDRFESVSILELEVKASEADLLTQADENIAAAFNACKSAGATSRTKLVLKSSKSTGAKLQALARKLFVHDTSREVLKRLWVTGSEKRLGQNKKPLDMLQQYLISTEVFLRKNGMSKAIDTEDAYKVLRKSYADNRHRFESAAVATETWS